MSLENTMSSDRVRAAQDVRHYLEAMGSRVTNEVFGLATPLLFVDEAPRLLKGMATPFNEIVDGKSRKGWVVIHNGCRVIWRA